MSDSLPSRIASCTGRRRGGPAAAPGACSKSFWALEGTGSRTAVIAAIEHLVTALRGMTVVCLVSDFITDEDVFGSRALRMLASHHDVVAIVPEDPGETALPGGRGTIRLRDPESGRALPVRLDAGTRQAYREAVAQRRQAIVDACYRVPIDCVFVPSDQPVMEPLLNLFARRRLA